MIARTDLRDVEVLHRADDLPQGVERLERIAVEQIILVRERTGGPRACEPPRSYWSGTHRKVLGDFSTRVEEQAHDFLERHLIAAGARRSLARGTIDR